MCEIWEMPLTRTKNGKPVDILESIQKQLHKKTDENFIGEL